MHDLLASFVLGWWCFPWGLGTPIVVIQNLMLLVLPNSVFDTTLDNTLASVGLRRTDVELDEHGLTGEERKLFKIALSVLAEAIWADGEATTEEFEKAVGIATALVGEKVSVQEAARGLETERDARPNLGELPPDFRLLLLHIASETVASDGRIAEPEATFLYGLAARLDIDARDVESVFGLFHDVAGADAFRDRDPDYVRACQVLGVEPGTSVVEMRSRYRGLMMEVHPDHSGSDAESQAEAHRVAQEVNWAYEYVLKGAA